MKKLIKLAAVACLALSVLSLVGCGDSSAPAEEETTTEAAVADEGEEVTEAEEETEEATDAEADAEAEEDATEEATEA